MQSRASRSTTHRLSFQRLQTQSRSQTAFHFLCPVLPSTSGAFCPASDTTIVLSIRALCTIHIDPDPAFSRAAKLHRWLLISESITLGLLEIFRYLCRVEEIPGQRIRGNN